MPESATNRPKSIAGSLRVKTLERRDRTPSPNDIVARWRANHSDGGGVLTSPRTQGDTREWLDTSSRVRTTVRGQRDILVHFEPALKQIDRLAA